MYSISDKLGLGIYSAAEAALYARVSTRLMARWVFGERDSKSVIKSELPETSERVVTFLDFVQVLAIREVRNRHRLSLQKIRQGIEEAKTRYGIEHPLAQQHTIYLLSDGMGKGHGEMVIQLPGRGAEGPDGLAQLTGRNKGNRVMEKVVEMFLADLHFEAGTGRASRYVPMTYKGAQVVLDPRRRFGEPIVEPGGYTAETLWDATNAEGGIDQAAEAYGVGVDEIMVANRYYDVITPNLAV